MRTCKPVVADAEIGGRTAAVCQLANVGYELRRPPCLENISTGDPAKTNLAGSLEEFTPAETGAAKFFLVGHLKNLKSGF